MRLANGVGMGEDPRLHGPMVSLREARRGLSELCGRKWASPGTRGPLAPSLPKPAANGDCCPLCLPTPQIPSLESAHCPQPLGDQEPIISLLPSLILPPASALGKP